MLPKSKWITVFNKPAQVKNRLFCFPYAGGSAQTFRNWVDLVPETTQLCALQMPGRSSRFTEPLLTHIDQVLDKVKVEIKPFLDKPFVFFGHSMGAAVSYELSRILQDQGLKVSHLFVSGRSSPDRPSEREQIHGLPEPEFRAKMKDLNGTPPEILEHEELMELMVPIVRADFTISETYKQHSGSQLTCPLTAFGGTDDDDIPEENMASWLDFSDGPTEYHMYEGDHFFLNPYREDIVRRISEVLNRLG